jgi:quinol-cytochrome oxidoreductase complex cytochrome b subunit
MSDTSSDHSHESKKDRIGERIAVWFDKRLGLSYKLLRPAPQYSINPFYWLGALAVVAFVIQGITGVMMMLYYIPSPSQAYQTTQYIFQNVSYGTFLETVHLYTAYAMIMLTFMHLMRGYFVSVHKRPREVMWVVGMIMGFVTLGFGFTGYLLPWTVVSKSATDVGLGMIQALPPPFSSFLTFLIIGTGGDTAELLRFYDLHVVVLPAILLALLGVKMYMLEAHGVSEPATGLQSDSPEKRKVIPIFPDVSFYLLELAAIFGAAMLLISVAFPLNLPPEYSAAVAGQYTAQPDWYFLWIYQILKISAFEQAGLPVALSAITLIFVGLVLLPFIDRSETRSIAKRIKYVTLGAIFVCEVAVLAVWGYLTPGQAIPNEQAVLVLGGIALLVTLGSTLVYRALFMGLRKVGSKPTTQGIGGTAVTSGSNQPTTHSASAWTAGSFVGLLALGTFSISSDINAVVAWAMQGMSLSVLSSLILASVGLLTAVVGAAYLLYRLDLPTGRIRRKVRAFELGWRR